MNKSTITHGIVIALLLNLACPVQAGWFSDWFSSRGAKATLAVGALASAFGIGYLIHTWNKKNKIKKAAAERTELHDQSDDESGQEVAAPAKKIPAPTRPAPKRPVAGLNSAPLVPTKEQTTIERLAAKNIAQRTIPTAFAAEMNQALQAKKGNKPAPTTPSKENAGNAKVVSKQDAPAVQAPQEPRAAYSKQELAQAKANATDLAQITRGAEWKKKAAELQASRDQRKTREAAAKK